MSPGRQGVRKIVLLMDAVMIVLSMLLASLLHPVLREFMPMVKEVPPWEEYALLAYLTGPLWLFLITILGLHRILERIWTRAELFVALVKLQLVGLLGLAVLVFITQGVVNRSLVGLFLAGSFILLYIERAIMQFWLRYHHERGHGQTRLLLVGEPSDEMKRFVEGVQKVPLPPRLIGRLGPEGDGPLEHKGRLDDLADLLKDEPVDQVLFFPPFNHPEKVTEALKACETLGIVAGFSIDLVQPAQAPPRLGTLYDHPFVQFDVAPRRPEALVVKHALDFTLALIAILALSPLLILIWLSILIAMGRPVVFSQERAGLNGRKFRMFKFRTMIREAEKLKAGLEEVNEMDGPVFKATDDPRVTGLGRFLRRLSLDELPQLFNVLLGTMSLVGPRPLPVIEQRQISGWHRRRLSMKPGITGLWQVSGRNLIGFEEWMKLDLVYVDEWSLKLDFRILIKTAWVVLTGKGAR